MILRDTICLVMFKCSFLDQFGFNYWVGTAATRPLQRSLWLQMTSPVQDDSACILAILVSQILILGCLT